MSGMQKLVVFVLVIAAGGYFALQWKIDKDIREEFDQLRPFVSVDFDKANIKLSGEISVSGVVVRPNMLNMSFRAQEVAWSQGNILQTLFGDHDFKSGNFPEKLTMKLQGLELPLSQIALELPVDTSPNSLDVLATAACGKHARFGLDELVDMGYDEVVLSFAMSMQDRANSDVLEVKGSVDIENMNRVEYEMSLDKRLAGRMQANGNPLHAIRAMQLNFVDTGYQQVKTIYCAREAGTSNAEYLQAHQAKVDEMLRLVEIVPTPEFSQAYANLLKPGSTLLLKMKPEPNVQFSDLAFYDADSIQRMLGLTVAVNNVEVGSFVENWHVERFNQIVAMQPEVETVTGFEASSGVVRRAQATESEAKGAEPASKEYKATGLSEAHQFIDEPVLLVRDNGKTYGGTLVRVEGEKMWINVAQSGEAIIPFSFDDIQEFQVLRD